MIKCIRDDEMCYDSSITRVLSLLLSSAVPVMSLDKMFTVLFLTLEDDSNF